MRQGLMQKVGDQVVKDCDVMHMQKEREFEAC